uniref:Zinc finger and BTB domain containing 26 n=1 Tax=Lates calcarifer TaxID=8187 RepID=A0A4W6C953_LATCA
MSGSSDTLRFCLPTHGDSILSKMNALREDLRFCDVTLLLRGPQGASVRPLRFHGHRVVLAASSDFLRDQFLLHEGRAELCVGVVSSMEVGKRLLLSCYTGLLEVPLRELVSYLTAASALQMSQVVEKCAQAISQYLPSTKEGGAVVIQSELNSGQGANVDSQGLREVGEDGKAVKAEEASYCFSTPESEEGGGIQAVHTNKPCYQVHHISGTLTCTLHSPTAAQDHISSTTIRKSGELMDSNLFCLSSAHLSKNHCSGDELTEVSDSVLVQRPYLCRRCDRVFQHLESYAGHLKEHRQYLCLVCGKGFSHKSNLSRHIRLHTGVKPFRCPLCHKTFSQKAPLQDHLNLHTGDKPHKCSYCAVHFAHKPGLRRHLKDVHGKSSLQNVLEPYSMQCTKFHYGMSSVTYNSGCSLEEG